MSFDTIEAFSIVVAQPQQLLRLHHFIISPSFIYKFPLPAPYINNPSRLTHLPPSAFYDLDQVHPPSTHRNIADLDCTSNKSHPATKMGTAPRRQLASTSHKRLKQPKQPKRTYKIPRSLKKAIKKNLVKIVRERDEEVSDSLVPRSTYYISLRAVFRFRFSFYQPYTDPSSIAPESSDSSRSISLRSLGSPCRHPQNLVHASDE